MGGAVPLGLGLALAQPSRRVLVVTGDGEMLMGLGSLSTVATQRPPNLTIVVLDNERYGETGMQLTHTAGSVDLGAIAAACGIPVCSTVVDKNGFKSVIPQIQTEEGPLFINIKVRAENLPLVLPPKDGAYLKDRFRFALLGADAII
jgi:thiamine pyrophosphate-dependent acetolactate synthase large subunit-like protein